MIADEILTYAGFLKNNLQTFFDYFTKGVQVLADTFFDSGNDNSHEIMAIPPEFYSTVYNENRANMFTDRFNSYADGQGMQPFLYACLVKLENGELNFIDYTMISQDYSGWWDDLDDSEIAELMTIEEAHDFNLHSYNAYPTEDIVQYLGNDNNFYFKPRNHSASDAGYTYTGYYGGNYGIHNMTSMSIGFVSGDFTRRGDRIDFSFSIPAITGNGFSGLYKQPFILVTDDLNAVNYYVTNNAADNNYSETVNTGDGDPFTVYYGDNYVIYYIPAGNKLSYDDIQLTTQRVVDVIVADNPGMDPVHIPTYDENKFGPEPPPEPDIDDDIEVEMDLNDAAFGTGLSHYYVTTVDAPVLSDISAAMSSWNINNTGKDLYRNLLSCRITKVGPIPAENSTFVIYGEELQHNGSPISINKITGNPSMDLGEYEILPKFNDFRDYAPYTKIEMFIPYCGWVALPSHVMSSEEKPKIITGTLLCDIIAGTCKAVIKCNETVVAEASGFTAVDVPFTGENVGMKMAGIASAITSYGNTASKTVGNIASGGMSGGAGAGASAAGGLVGLLGSYAQLHSAFNANYTEICGKTGDGCNVAGLNKVYIKIQRPKTGGYEEPDFVPEDYGHTTGFIAMKKKQISECEGLIICANPDTSGIGGATDRERQMIKNLLESGIIVRQTEPEP